MSRLAHAKNLGNWMCLKKLDDETRARLRKFAYHNGTLYGVTRDHRLIAFGYKLLGVENARKEIIVAEIQQFDGKKVVDIVGGKMFVMVRTADGQLWGWGDNTKGQVGVGTGQAWYDTPQLIFRDNIIDVHCGDGHVLALDRAGKVFAWGDNECHQVGGGDDDGGEEEAQISSPHPVDLEDNVVMQIQCTGNTSAVLTNKREVFMWGMTFFETKDTKYSLERPTKVSIGQQFKAIVGGAEIFLFQTIAGDIYAFDTTIKAFREACTRISFEKIYYSGASSFFGTTTTGEVYRWDENELMLLNFRWNGSRHQRHQWTNFSPVHLDLRQVGTSQASNIRDNPQSHFPELFEWSNIRDIPWAHLPGLFELSHIRDIPRSHSPMLLEWRNIDPDSFDSAATSDLIFTFPGGQTIHAHRSQLSAVSEHLCTQLSTSSGAEVCIETYSYAIFYKYLKYLYTGLLQPESFEETLDLVDLANCYLEHDLLDACLDLLLVRYLDAQTYDRLRALADTYHLEEFGSKVQLYLAQQPLRHN